MEIFVMPEALRIKEKFTNLHMRSTFGMRSQRCCTGGALRVAVDGNRENLRSKNFWNESRFQVVTRKVPAVQVLEKTIIK